MRYTKVIRTSIEEWVTIGQYVEEMEPSIYRKLKLKYPIVSRIIVDEREFWDMKILMEEKRGVNL